MKSLCMAAVLACVAGSAMAQPGNDSCTAPEAVGGYGSFSFDSSGAGTDGPATGCGGGTANNDVWFCWTASASGPTKAEICGSGAGFDTVLAVYDGCGCPTDFTEIACNDDSCGLQSSVNFTATAGQSYMIRVGGYSDGDTGAGAVAVAPYLPGVVVGPVVSPINGHTYYLLEASSWTEGEASAQLFGGHLATVRSIEENDWIFDNILNPGGGFRRGWIGLNDAVLQDDYHWTSGEPVTFTFWGSGEPNHADGIEFYAQIPWFSRNWNDNRDFPLDDPSYPIVEVVTDPGCPADFNGDGFLDFFDYDDYVNCFETGNCPPGKTADFNGDGFADFFDYDDFVGAFQAGC